MVDANMGVGRTEFKLYNIKTFHMNTFSKVFQQIRFLGISYTDKKIIYFVYQRNRWSDNLQGRNTPLGAIWCSSDPIML